jgi:hypothetical protein
MTFHYTKHSLLVYVSPNPKILDLCEHLGILGVKMAEVSDLGLGVFLRSV